MNGDRPPSSFSLVESEKTYCGEELGDVLQTAGFIHVIGNTIYWRITQCP
jgi:hypothetical protein